MRRLLLVCIALSALAVQSAVAQTTVTAKDVQRWEGECARGDALSCGAAGESYYYGEGVKLDKKRALTLFGKACDLKEEQGCKNYATLKGQGH